MNIDGLRITSQTLAALTGIQPEGLACNFKNDSFPANCRETPNRIIATVNKII